MQKIVLLLVCGLFLVFASPVGAQADEAKARAVGQEVVKAAKEEAKEEGKEFRLEIREQAREFTQEIKRWRQQVAERLKLRFPKLLSSGLNQGEVISISATKFPATVVVKHDEKEVILEITDKTVILRKFGGRSSLAELKVGDIVSARGNWKDEEEAVLEARVLRNLSVGKRQGSFWGTISSIGTDSFSLKAGEGRELRVFVGPSAKIVDQRNQGISFADLKAGHRVRVFGLWDLALDQVESVRSIKDWSFLKENSPSATPTP
jgi:hypothetical protein